MKLSTTLLLALLLSGLSAYYFAVEKPSSTQPAEIFTPKILSLGEEDFLTHLEIHEASREKIALTRQGADWVLVSPVQYPAENFLVEGMIQALAFSRRERRFKNPKDGEGEFGFDSPAVKISIQTEKNPGARTLFLGADSPVGAGVYARWEGEEEVFLVPTLLKASFERTVYSLRRKKLFRLSWEDVTWVDVKTGPRKFRLNKRGRKWHWTLPALKGEIPLEKALDLVYSFQSLYIKEFLDGRRPGERKFGLVAQEIILAVGDRKGRREKLILGKPAKGKDAFFAVREGEDLVLLVSAKNLRALLELFEITFQELQGDDPKEARGNSGTDSKGVREGPAQSL